MGAVDTAKELFRLAQKLDNIEIVQKVFELQGELIELQEEVSRLKKENERLQDAGDTDSKLAMSHGVYYLQDDSVHTTRRGPFCTQCWTIKQKLVPLEVISEKHRCFMCHTCDSRFGRIPPPMPRPSRRGYRHCDGI